VPLHPAGEHRQEPLRGWCPLHCIVGDLRETRRVNGLFLECLFLFHFPPQGSRKPVYGAKSWSHMSATASEDPNTGTHAGSTILSCRLRLRLSLGSCSGTETSAAMLQCHEPFPLDLRTATDLTAVFQGVPPGHEHLNIGRIKLHSSMIFI
jgi:hypothetical protein